jgi:membrane-bound lytic murein transglycosylase
MVPLADQIATGIDRVIIIPGVLRVRRVPDPMCNEWIEDIDRRIVQRFCH